MSPTKRLANYDLMCGLIIIMLVNAVTGRGNSDHSSSSDSDHCQGRKFASAFNTSYMQFTKEAVSEEYAIQGEFKNLHCCAKGYRSIEWFKDGQRYPWSADDISSLIVYPEAANQTIYARKTSKVDEGRYTCVVSNDTHRMEHQVELKILDSSPDVPLATFSPGNQFADVGGDARFFCEAFVGKKDLPDISISIRWYQITDDNQDRPISDENQEVVKREEEQIIGSYLTIDKVTLSDFGRYLCRVEMGKSQMHRLEVSAELINALPVPMNRIGLLFNPYFLASVAAVITVLLFFLLLHTQSWWRTHLITFSSNELEILNMKSKVVDVQPNVFKKSEVKRQSDPHEVARIMIDVV